MTKMLVARPPSNDEVCPERDGKRPKVRQGARPNKIPDVVPSRVLTAAAAALSNLLDTAQQAEEACGKKGNTADCDRCAQSVQVVRRDAG